MDEELLSSDWPVWKVLPVLSTTLLIAIFELYPPAVNESKSLECWEKSLFQFRCQNRVNSFCVDSYPQTNDNAVCEGRIYLYLSRHYFAPFIYQSAVIYSSYLSQLQQATILSISYYPIRHTTDR